MGNRKIFCVGLHKTGTASLAAYFRTAGLTSCHWPARVGGIDYEKRVAPIWTSPDKVVECLTPVLDAYTVHSDVPWPGLVEQLAKRYRGGLFVLSLREEERWWESLKAHWALSIFRHRLSPFERIQYHAYLTHEMRFVSTSDRDLMIAAFRLHRLRVEEAVPKQQLLIVDISDPEIHLQLAHFAGLDPSLPFPSGKPRPDPAVKAKRLLKKALLNRFRFGAQW